MPTDQEINNHLSYLGFSLGDKVDYSGNMILESYSKLKNGIIVGYEKQSNFPLVQFDEPGIVSRTGDVIAEKYISAHRKWVFPAKDLRPSRNKEKSIEEKLSDLNLKIGDIVNGKFTGIDHLKNKIGIIVGRNLNFPLVYFEGDKNTHVTYQDEHIKYDKPGFDKSCIWEIDRLNKTLKEVANDQKIEDSLAAFGIKIGDKYTGQVGDLKGVIGTVVGFDGIYPLVSFGIGGVYEKNHTHFHSAFNGPSIANTTWTISFEDIKNQKIQKNKVKENDEKIFDRLINDKVIENDSWIESELNKLNLKIGDKVEYTTIGSEVNRGDVGEVVGFEGSALIKFSNAKSLSVKNGNSIHSTYPSQDHTKIIFVDLHEFNKVSDIENDRSIERELNKLNLKIGDKVKVNSRSLLTNSVGEVAGLSGDQIVVRILGEKALFPKSPGILHSSYKDTMDLLLININDFNKISDMDPVLAIKNDNRIISLLEKNGFKIGQKVKCISKSSYYSPITGLEGEIIGIQEETYPLIRFISKSALIDKNPNDIHSSFASNDLRQSWALVPSQDFITMDEVKKLEEKEAKDILEKNKQTKDSKIIDGLKTKNLVLGERYVWKNCLGADKPSLTLIGFNGENPVFSYYDTTEIAKEKLLKTDTTIDSLHSGYKACFKQFPCFSLNNFADLQLYSDYEKEGVKSVKSKITSPAQSQKEIDKQVVLSNQLKIIATNEKTYQIKELKTLPAIPTWLKMFEQKKPSNTKLALKKAGYRIIAKQTLKLAHQTILHSFRKISKTKEGTISNLLDSEYGKAMISLILGISLDLNKLEDYPSSIDFSAFSNLKKELAKEFRVGGMTIAGNELIETIFSSALNSLSQNEEASVSNSSFELENLLLEEESLKERRVS